MYLKRDPRLRQLTFGAISLALLSLGVAAGCGLSAASNFNGNGSGGDQTTGNDNNGNPGPEFVSSDDGGDGAASGLQGNPLCHVRYDSVCVPDNAESCSPVDDSRRQFGPSGDAGGPKADGTPQACHVRLGGEDAGAASPTCLPAGKGTDGAECIRSTDCAAGFECVGSPGQCRHYCCDGQSSCKEMGKHFCDIQAPAEQGSLKVPACMPVRPCVLLGEGCSQGETCAVVADDGTTSCVGVGPARAGESCETAHCAEELTCLGQPGLRRCYKLCRKNASMPCGSGERCKGAAPLFQDATVGICSKT